MACEFVETKDGPTVWEDHFYPEVVDPETGEVLPDGTEGELVFTSLTKQAMPVVRYRTRDLTRLLPGSIGPMRRMAKITGRSDDMLIVRGVNMFPSQIEEQILRCAGLGPHYRIDVARPDRLDEVTVHVELNPECGAEERRRAAAELDAALDRHTAEGDTARGGDRGGQKPAERFAGVGRRRLVAARARLALARDVRAR